jgi:hypothetical protein
MLAEIAAVLWDIIVYYIFLATGVFVSVIVVIF